MVIGVGDRGCSSGENLESQSSLRNEIIPFNLEYQFRALHMADKLFSLLSDYFTVYGHVMRKRSM